MIVPSRYVALVLALLVGIIAGFFVWQLGNWTSESEQLQAPTAFERHITSSTLQADAEKRYERDCPDIKTFAEDSVSRVCHEFTNPCDVPVGWVRGCTPLVSATSTSTSAPPKNQKPPKKGSVQLVP